MALLPRSFDYSARDFDALRLRLQGLVRSVFPDWTDFNVANFGNILLELFAHVGDVLNYYQDSQAAEAFWPTLQQRISAIRLGRLMNFTLRGAAAATTAETFSLPFAAPKVVLINSGTRLRTSDPESPLAFQTMAYAEIAIGQKSVSVAVEQSEARSDTFISTDEPNQSFTLKHTPFLDGSLDALGQITAEDGPYMKVSTLLGSKSTDRVFLIDVDQLDRGYIQFGDGVTGAIPHGELTVNYKIGGGLKGNVEVDHITIVEDAVFYSDSQPAPVSVTNLQAASGGADRMSLAEARMLAPASLRVLTRTVTKEDFETVAKSVRGVARALMVTSNEFAGIQENTGRLYIVAQGAKLASGRIAPDAPSQALLDAVKAEIDTNKPSTITFSYVMYAAAFKSVSIRTRIYLKQGASGATVGGLIRAALADFFAAQLPEGIDNPDIDFGANLKDVEGTIQGELAWSDVFNAIRDVEGIRKVDEGAQGLLFNTGSGWLRSSVVLLPIEFPKLSSVDITDADTGAAL